MILECPNCEKRYLVDPRAIGAKGRVVRCASCKNEWHAESDPVALEDAMDEVTSSFDDAVDDIESDAAAEEAGTTRRRRATANVPAIVTARPVPMAVKLATGLMAVFFVLTAAIYLRAPIVHHVPAVAGVYDMLGLYETEGVVLADLAYNKEPVGLKDRHRISGYIVNTSDVARRLPSLRAQLLGDEGQVIKGQLLKKVAVLEPGGKQKFTQELDTSPDSVTRVLIEIGNPLDLKLRSRK